MQHNSLICKLHQATVLKLFLRHKTIYLLKANLLGLQYKNIATVRDKYSQNNKMKVQSKIIVPRGGRRKPNGGGGDEVGSTTSSVIVPWGPNPSVRTRSKGANLRSEEWARFHLREDDIPKGRDHCKEVSSPGPCQPKFLD